jgi:hypothetical protein
MTRNWHISMEDTVRFFKIPFFERSGMRKLRSIFSQFSARRRCNIDFKNTILKIIQKY